jgi:hypothetical protein
MVLFQKALSLGFDEFTFQLKGKPLSMAKVDTVRLEIAIRYRTRARQTIEVDLGWSRTGAVDLVEPVIVDLQKWVCRVPSPVRCLNLSEQVAQKLHACTGPYSQERARDVLDILLIDQLRKLDLASVRDAAEQVFNARGTHSFPPTIQIPGEWQAELEALAKELGVPSRFCLGD